jgi:nicotinamidase-related amidase
VSITALGRRWALSPDHVDLRGPADAQRKSRPAELAAAPQRLTIDLARAALIVVDMQNDFCSPEGWLASIGVDTTPATSAINELTRILPAIRSAGVPVIWLNWGNRPDRANLPPNVTHVYDADGSGGGIGERASRSEAVLTEGSWGAAIVDGLDVDAADLHVAKFRMSGFFDTPLDSILRQLVEGASATTSPQFCLDATLYNVRQCFGFTTTPDELLEALAS